MAVWELQQFLFALKSAIYVLGHGMSKVASMCVNNRDKMRWLWTAVGKTTYIRNKKHAILCPLESEMQNVID